MLRQCPARTTIVSGRFDDPCAATVSGGIIGFAKGLRFFDFARCARNESRVAAHVPAMERVDRFYSDCSGDCSQCKRTLEHRLVAPRTLRFTWPNVLPLKRSAYLSNSDLTRTAEVRHRTIRYLVSKPDEHCGNLECPRKPTTSIRALARAWVG